MLLERARRKVPAALEHLVGMQAQAPDAPYVGLWTRLDSFTVSDPRQPDRGQESRPRPAHAGHRAPGHGRRLREAAPLGPVRAGADVLQPAVRQETQGHRPGGGHRRRAGPARRQPDDPPRTRQGTGQTVPDRDPSSLAYAVTFLLPVVQVPPRGVWGQRGPARLAPARDWTGRPHDGEPDPARLVLRYLGAFGPASVQDVQAWSGLTRLREVTDQLGKRVRRFQDEDGRELLDLPRAPAARPGHARAAPVPARVRQPAVLARRPQPGHHRQTNGPAAAGQRRHPGHPARRRPLRRHLEGHPAQRPGGAQVTTFSRLTETDVSAVTSEGLDLLAFIAPEGKPGVAVRHEKDLCNGA